MTEQLALRYRPRSFDDLVGQKAVNLVLRAMVAADKVPTALLFRGSRGTGKTTTARILAAALNCDTPPGPCTECVSCKSVFDGTSLDLLEIDAASNGLVDDIRELRQQVLYGVGGRFRVVVLDEAHSMSNAAFNALLKTLEEPPPATVFILATTEPGRIPGTVASRLMPFTFARITATDITARLTHICDRENITAEPALLVTIAERADGSMRDAVMLLDQLTRASITTVDAYTELSGAIDSGPTLLAAIATGDPAAAYAAATDILRHTGDAHALADALTATVRDLLVLRAGGDLTAQASALAARRQLAERIDTSTLFAAMNTMWELRTKARPGDDPRAGLDLAIALLVQKFIPSEPATTATPRKLTLAEMAALAK